MISTKPFKNIPAKTQSISKATLVENIPGYTAETSTFALMIGAMIAQGIRTRAIIAALFWQILMLAVTGVAIGAGLLGLTQFILPKAMPFYANPPLFIAIAAALILMSLVGGLFSLRRILHIDPLAAIGGE